MNLSAQLIAESATYQAFVNCYLNEIDSGKWHNSNTWQQQNSMHGLLHGSQVIELVISYPLLNVAIDVVYESVTGHHQFGTCWIRQSSENKWAPINPLNLLIMMVRHIFHQQHGHADEPCQQETELLYRLIDSYQQMSRYISERWNDPVLNSDLFIASEQSLLYGHWHHPTPKSRQGIHSWQQAIYSPELKGQFQLIYYAVEQSYIDEHSLVEQSPQHIIQTLIGHDKTRFALEPNERLMPLHPLQAHWLQHQPAIQQAIKQGILRELGQAGPLYTPTSSVRTLYNPDSQWMVKFSIPVKITNSMRINQVHELAAGVTAAELIKNSGFTEKNSSFKLINDPAYISLKLPNMHPSGFEVVFRENPFTSGQDTGIHCLAALLQEPLAHRPSRLRSLIEGLALSQNRSVKEVSHDWFSHYWRCAIDPLLRLYDEHGIALEAHQQNSLLDVSSGYPCRYFYRDNQGFYLNEYYRTHLLNLSAHAENSDELFYPESMIEDRFGYYLFLNQLAAVIHRFGADGLLSETSLVALSRQKLQLLQQQLNAAGLRLIDRLLIAPTLPCKANLLTRVHDVDELTADKEQAVYINVNNPFFTTKKVIADAEHLLSISA